MKPCVATVVLNYNGAEDTVRCVSSLKVSSYPTLHILVVDNGSADGSVAFIREALPGVELLEMKRNLGFTGGNNAGICYVRKWKPQFILIINNDTTVEPGFLEPLVDALVEDQGAAVAAGTVCYFPETETVQYAGGDLIRWRGSGFARGQGKQYSDLEKCGVSPVTFVSGCLMLLRTSDVESLGMFDSRFFLYCEDSEMSLRLAAAGRRLLYVPRSRIYHRMEHRSKRPMQYYYMFRNRLLLIDLLPGRLERVIGRVYMGVIIGLKLLVWRFRRPDLFRATLMGWEDHARGVLSEGRGTMLVSRSGH